MTIPITEDKPPFPISTKLLKFYNHGAHRIKNFDTMKIGFYYGFPGCGKSVAAQKAMFITNAGKCEQYQIAMDKPEFVKAVLHNRKVAIIADEALSIMFSRAAMSQRGRETMELFGQMRSHNLMVLICVHDILLIDKSILKMGNFIIRTYETEELDSQGNTYVTKGNLEIYPKPTKRGHENYYYKLIKWERINQQANYLVKNPKPHPAFTEPGQRYYPERPCFYAVERDEYIERKDSVLKKYDKPERKPRNASIDFTRMDTMLSLGMRFKDIQAILNCSKGAILNRKAQGYYKALMVAKPKRRTGRRPGT